LTVGGAGGLTGISGGQTVNDIEAGRLTGHLWQPDHPGTGAGDLTEPWWRSDHQGQFWLLENILFQKRLCQGFQKFKFRDHSEIFTDQGEERWCLLEILNNILTRIRNLSKMTTID
jgi:hypothetical protein